MAEPPRFHLTPEAQIHTRTMPDGARIRALILPHPKPRALDATASLHHDAKMRTTIDLPQDLHHVLTSLSISTRKSLSQTAVDLMQRGLRAPATGPARTGAKDQTSPLTGLPLVRLARTVTPEDVKALEDER